MQGEDFDQAVEMLLSGPNIAYVENMQDTLKSDPSHLVYHRLSVAYKVRALLWAEARGIYVEDDSVAILILNAALLRITKTAAA
jgi:hypothetical protein